MEPANGLGDAELVERARAGDASAFGELVDRYEGIVTALARQRVPAGGDAEDVVQEAFLKAYARLADLKDPERFGAWLYGIALRVSIDHLRKRGRSGRLSSLDAARAAGAPEPTSGAGDGLEQAVARERAEQVLEALGALPERYRVVLTLRYQGHQSYAEIAEHLGEPAGTIANRIHRAIGMLRARLPQEARR